MFYLILFLFIYFFFFYNYQIIIIVKRSRKQSIRHALYQIYNNNNNNNTIKITQLNSLSFIFLFKATTPLCYFVQFLFALKQNHVKLQAGTTGAISIKRNPPTNIYLLRSQELVVRAAQYNINISRR